MTVEATHELKMEIKALILEALKINDVKPEEIDDEKSLFEGKNVLQIDSVDALEIVMAAEKSADRRWPLQTSSLRFQN